MSMLSYILKKLTMSLLSLFFILTITFFLMKIIPGDPFIQEAAIPQEILTSLKKHYGLDQPLFTQYIKYLRSVIKCDLGPSYIYQGRSVNEIIKEGFPISAILGIEAMLISFVMGIILGSISANFKNKWQDTTAMVIAILGISIPGFLLATFLQYLLSVKLSIFPVARWNGLYSSILPAISLAATPTAFIARLMRSKLTEVLQQDYIKTALSKGLSYPYVIYKHAIRNAVLPVIGYIGPVTAQILTGSFVIEKIFGIPGMGLWLTSSIANRDYTTILGITLFFSFILIMIIFLIDFIYGIIDPRIKIISTKNEKKYC
jgi:oligopeptide transport system permease protein